MSFRGRYPSKFRRSGNFRGHERPVFKERGRPFKRTYYEGRGSPQSERIQDRVPIRGRGRKVERETDYYPERGRGRPFKKYFSDRGQRPSRSRGRYFRGRQSHFRGSRGRGRRFQSPENFENERYHERHGPPGDFPGENEFEEEERFERRGDEPDEWYEGEEGDEYYDDEDNHIPFEHRARSPLTIHRRFDDEEYEESPDRPRSPMRRSPSLERRHYSEERERSFERLETRDRRQDSVEFRRSHSIERGDHFTHQIDRLSPDRFVGHQRSLSPGQRDYEGGRERSTVYVRRSIERSLSPPRPYRSRERNYRSSDRERSTSLNSRRSIERQIAYEKKRLQQILEHEKKIHEKRSESSIERFLDDCKRSFENNPKSRSVSRSSSFDARDFHPRTNKRSLDRSLSPLDRSRSFKGLENITIERGRSLERSHSPVRQRSPFWREDFRQDFDNNSNCGSKSRIYESRKRRRSLSRNISPEVSFDRRSALSNGSPSREFRERPTFLGQRERPFLEEQGEPFLEGHKRHFLEERERLFLEDRERPFLEDREKPFLEDRERAFLGERNRNMENRELDHDSLRVSTASRIRESSYERRSQSSPSHAQSSKRRNYFLGVGDGPFLENRSISKDEKDHDNLGKKYHNMSSMSVSQKGSLDVNERFTNETNISSGLHHSRFDTKYVPKTKRTKGNLELSPVSQPSSDKREFPDYHEACPDDKMDLSPISQTKSFGKGEFSHDIKNDHELSPISQGEDFGNEDRNNSSKINACEIGRPSSTDSMQKFLAELEEDERSRSSIELSHLQENVHGLRNANEGQGQKTNAPMKPLNYTEEHNRFDKFSSTNSLKEKTSDTPQKPSYYDFKFSCDLTTTKNTDEPQNKLFNAYEKSFLNQTYDAYNENLFQGRFEQSSKSQSKNIKPVKDTSLSFTHKTPTQPLNFNKTSELSSPSAKQQVPNRPPHYQSFDNNNKETLPSIRPGNLPNQMPQKINPLLSGNSVRPGFYPTQVGPMPLISTFQQIPNILPNIIPPVPFQPNTLLANQSAHPFQPPPKLMENLVGKPMFSQIGQVPNNQLNWKNQSSEFHNSFGKPGQVSLSNQIGGNNFSSSFPVQSFQNTQFPPNQSYLQPSEKLSQNSYLPNQSMGIGGNNQFTPWPANSGQKQFASTNIAHDKGPKKKIPVQHNVKEVIVISDEEGTSKKYDDDKDDDLVFSSNGIIIPSPKTVEKYKYCIPPYNVLGKIFKGFVIYFGVKENSELQKDPIEVLQESFTTSEGFERLDIEERSELKRSSETIQVCELRWRGLLLSRGEGDSREEARQVAGIALINALAKTCYTVQTKYGYYNMGKYPKFMLKHPEKPGYYKMIKRDELIKSVADTVKKLRAQGLAKGVDATHVNAVISFMDDFFKDTETHCELIFGPSSGMEYTLGELQTLARHAATNGLQYRWFHGTKKVKVVGRFLAVSRHFSPQALQRYLLSEEMGDTVRYRLYPPQGPQINLLTPGNYYSPNMIKTILPMMGPDGKLRSDFDESTDDVSFEDSKDYQEPNQLSQDTRPTHQQDSAWRRFSSDQGLTSSQSNQSMNPRFQSQGQNYNPGFQSGSRPPNPNTSFQNTNPQNMGFNPSPQGSVPGVSNPFMQGGYNRSAPFQGDSYGKRGKWV